MGFFDVPYASDDTKNSGGFLYDVFDPFDISGKRAGNAAAGYQSAADQERQRWKNEQYDLLSKRQFSAMTPQQEARLKALETESTTPLEQDPHFQTQMRLATGGGAQALAGIQNQQVARGAAGGFANQGSISDVYDRMGTQLAQIGQQQTAYKENAGAQAADARQKYSDAQVAYNNSINDAKMAIESGDHQALSSAMDRAYQAQAAAEAQKRQMALGVVEAVAGVYTGNPSGVANGAKAVGGAQNQGQGPTMDSYNSQSPSPYASSNYFSDSLNSGNQGYKPYYQTRGY